MRQETCIGSQDISVNGNAQATTGGHTGTGVWNADHHLNKTVQITGTFTGTVTVMGSVDGTNWAPVAGPVTAPSILTVSASLKAMSLLGSSWGSGTATGIYSYFNSRSDPG